MELFDGASQSVQSSELVTESVKLSPLQDLLERTLTSIQGSIRKLVFLVDSRNAAGEYEHWGFSKEHGETATQQVFASAHSTLFERVLTTSIEELLQDLQLSAASLGESAPELLMKLDSELAVPCDTRGCLPKHLSSAVETLSTLWPQYSIRRDA